MGSFFASRKSKKVFSKMEPRKENGLLGLMTADQLKAITQMGRNMKLGQAGGTMIEPVKKCMENTETGKWLISGISMIRMEI